MLRRTLVAACFVGASGLALVACSASGDPSFSNDPLNGAGADGSGANGGGGGVVFGQGASSGSSGTPGVMMRIGDTNCVADVRQGEHVPLDIYVMFDQSLSMSCQTAAGPTRWDALKSAMTTFVQDPAAAGISVGIQYFGQGSVPFLSSCDVNDYLNADVEIAPLPPNAQPIVTSLGAHGPGTNTPTPVALQGAIQHAATWKSQHQGDTVVVVLVTDGEPNACGAIADIVNTASTGLSQSGIQTYVVGVVAGGVDCGILDPNPPNQADLDAVAVAGGTNAALIVDASQNAEQQFLAKMDQIRGNAQIPCQFQIPPPPPGDHFDRNMVNVEFTDSSGNPTIVYAVGDQSQCDAANGGWYFEGDPQAPTAIDLCPTTCTTVTTTVGIAVKVALGCQSITPPH